MLIISEHAKEAFELSKMQEETKQMEFKTHAKVGPRMMMSYLQKMKSVKHNKWNMLANDSFLYFRIHEFVSNNLLGIIILLFFNVRIPR